eukprot:53872-Hanusia_phi.AAC.2
MIPPTGPGFSPWPPPDRPGAGANTVALCERPAVRPGPAVGVPCPITDGGPARRTLRAAVSDPGRDPRRSDSLTHH